jgi:ribosomal protein S18 acetylase RimI-like enzyme
MEEIPLVKLVPMQPSDLESYLAVAVQEYARDKIHAGNYTASEGLEKARAEFDALLPKGIETPKQHLFSILNKEAEKVGIIWLAEIQSGAQRFAFIYDIRIYEQYRRKGFGTQAMLAVEEQAKSLGLNRIALHVFGHNKAAQELYEKIGYEITNINMSKKI